MTNLEEAQFYCSNIMVADPSILAFLKNKMLEMDISDLELKRLKQYKILQEKTNDTKKYQSNRDFLLQSDIKATIIKPTLSDCERIHELIMRTNQLNYTKKRIGFEEVKKLLEDATIDTGMVKVSDRYGDYGTVGFYAIRNDVLIHFLFSCRTMGMGIEQYTYAKLKWPKLSVEGDVADFVKSGVDVDWINLDSDNVKEITEINSKHKVLAKGPCDMQQVFSYIANSERFVDEEYTFVDEINGHSIESHNSTTHIVEFLTLDEEQKKEICAQVPFGSEKLFETNMFSEKYSYIFLSLFTDAHGLYKNIDTGAFVSFGEYLYDLTDEKNWEGYISGDIFNANVHFDIDSLKKFKNKYKYMGRIDIDGILKNLDIILDNLTPGTKLVLFLGSEMKYEDNIQPAYEGRELFHRDLNRRVYQWKKERENVYVIDFNHYINAQEDFFNNINHFVKRVYYAASKDVIKLLSDNNYDVKQRGKIFLLLTTIYQKYILKIKIGLVNKRKKDGK